MSRSVGRLARVLLFGLFLGTSIAAGAETPATGAASPAAAIRAPAVQGIDLVVLVDNSQYLLPWYRDLTDYLIGPFVKDYLRLGDDFHLLSYGAETQLEISRRILAESDIRAVLGRIYLLYPLDPHADFIAALERLGSYVGALSPARPKTIVIVTTGVEDPPPTSRSAGLGAEENTREVEKASASLRAFGWPLHVIKLPFAPTSSSARSGSTAAPALAEVPRAGMEGTGSGAAASAGAGAVAVNPSTRGGSGAEGDSGSPPPAGPTEGAAVSGTAEGATSLAEAATEALGATVTEWKGAEGSQASGSTLPRRGLFSALELFGSTKMLILVLAAIFVIAVLFFLLIGRIPFRAQAPLAAAVKRSARNQEGQAGTGALAAKTGMRAPGKEQIRAPDQGSGPRPVSGTRISAVLEPALGGEHRPGGMNTAVDQAPASTTASASRRSLGSYTAIARKQGSVRIEMRVADQNSHVGQRNIHELKAGGSRSVGGGRSDFLVFLVRVPAGAGELHFDGETCVFVPLRAELFPGLSGPVTDCLGRDIPMVSPRGYSLSLRFTAWEAPAARINRLLHCIEVPGLPPRE